MNALPKFESLLWQALRSFSAERVIFVESESKKIGDLRVPEALMTCMRASPCVRVEVAMDERVKLLIEDYPHLVSDPSLLGQQLAHLIPLHGHEKVGSWQALADAGRTDAVVEALLVDHYDPAYLRSTTRKVGDLAFLDVTGRVARTRECAVGSPRDRRIF